MTVVYTVNGHKYSSPSILRYIFHIKPHFSNKLLFRDRPFNLKQGFFLFRTEFFFRTTQELEYIFFLSRKARIFFPEFNIRLYDKNSESDFFFFPPPQSEYFFQQHWESEYFLEKKHTPPPPFQVKWSFPKSFLYEF